MSTKEVPQDQWVAFFEGFRRMHHDAPVIVELMSGGVLQTIVRNLPLRDMTADLRDDRQHMISISTGEAAGHYMTHIVRSPTRVELQATGERALQSLRIESLGGMATLLRFQPGAQPDAEWKEEVTEERGEVSI